jgi:7-cyano-7-deazaguanine synthase
MKEGHHVFPLVVNYGQKNQAEITSARRIYERAAVDAGGFGAKMGEARMIEVRGLDFGTSALMPMGSDLPDMRENDFPGVPPTYVPGRNALLIALAGSYAEAVGAEEIWTGFQV